MLLLLLLLAGFAVHTGDTCAKFINGPYWQLHQAEYTWKNASDICMKRFEEIHGFGKTYTGGWCAVHHTYRVRMEKIMIVKWFCVTQCQEEMGGSAHSVGCHNGIGHRDSANSEHVKLKCECYPKKYTKTHSFAYMNDKWQAGCFKHNITSTGCHEIPHLIGNSAPGAKWVYSEDLIHHYAHAGSNATIQCAAGYETGDEDSDATHVIVKCDAMTRKWSVMHNCIVPVPSEREIKFEALHARMKTLLTECARGCAYLSVPNNPWDKPIPKAHLKQLLAIVDAPVDVTQLEALCSAVAGLKPLMDACVRCQAADGPAKIASVYGVSC